MLDLANRCRTGGLAVLIAHSITEDTSHSVVLLSRAVSRWRSVLNPGATLLDTASQDHCLTFTMTTLITDTKPG